VASRRTRFLHAVRVAATATAVVAVVAIVTAFVFNVVVVHRLTRTVDQRLSAALIEASRSTPGDAVEPGAVEPGSTVGTTRAPVIEFHGGGDLDDAPSFLWQVDHSGRVTALSVGAPGLPVHQWTGVPTDLAVAGTTFRFDSLAHGGGWLVAGQSVGEIGRVSTEVLIAEVLLGTLLLIVTFAGSLVVGLRASAPIEQIRRRQAEFTADASHELRTPLSVIEAEVDLALSRPRDPASYRGTLLRIDEEGRRLRSIVTDLLWLARADGDPSALDDAAVALDLTLVASACVDRFRAVAEAESVTLTFVADGEPQRLVRSSPESMDRLISVLVDNACRYAGRGGAVRITVDRHGTRVSLTVDDSGPGIPEEHREQVFDRFHRVRDAPGGTGLGLAIADAVVRTTGGSWTIDRSPLGGARLRVTWRHAPGHPSTDAGHGAGTPEDPDRGGVRR